MSVAGLSAHRTIMARKSHDEGANDNKDDGNEAHDDGTNNKKHDFIENCVQDQQAVSAAADLGAAVSAITVNSVNKFIVKK